MLYNFRYSGRGDGWTLLVEARSEEEAVNAVRKFDYVHECGRWGGSPEDPFDPEEDIGVFGWFIDEDKREDYAHEDMGMLEVGVTLIRPRQRQEEPWGPIEGEWEYHTISSDDDTDWSTR